MKVRSYTCQFVNLHMLLHYDKYTCKCICGLQTCYIIMSPLNLLMIQYFTVNLGTLTSLPGENETLTAELRIQNKAVQKNPAKYICSEWLSISGGNTRLKHHVRDGGLQFTSQEQVWSGRLLHGCLCWSLHTGFTSAALVLASLCAWPRVMCAPTQAHRLASLSQTFQLS